MAVDGAGNVYISDSSSCRIRRIDPQGIITTVGGTGDFGSDGDTGPAVAATLSGPKDVAVEPSGNLYIADTNNSRIRRVDPRGIITTVAGSGVSGYSGDGGDATAARMNGPSGVAVHPSGGVLIADGPNDRVRWCAV
ncbi:hypothetical protein IU450_33045 [Nocardia abscessus]|nr:hypothetical protein [Nocardia abscessus]